MKFPLRCDTYIFMLQYLIKRLILMVPLMIGITLISFIVTHLAPGEPAGLQVEMAPKVTREARERIRAYYGLDKPLYVQYLTWLKRFVSLDFGNSFSPDGRKVTDKIVERLPITIMINVLSLALIFIVAIPLGVLSATHQDEFIDKATTVFVFIGFAIPTFWLALLLMILFGVHLSWLPISGLRSMDYEGLTSVGKIVDMSKHLVMPLFVASFGELAGLSRYMRGSMLEVLRQDYVITARAKGLPEGKVIYKHALRNALLPAITILGLSVPGLIGGSVIFETIFAIPGMGQLFYASVMSRDYPVIMGGIVITAILTLIGNLLADIFYAIADPRIRRS